MCIRDWNQTERNWPVYLLYSGFSLDIYFLSSRMNVKDWCYQDLWNAPLPRRAAKNYVLRDGKSQIVSTEDCAKQCLENEWTFVSMWV